jgi:hypothetical protein
MPSEDEVQTVLDALYISKNLNWMFEQKMWDEAKRKADYTMSMKLKGINPSRYWPGWAKGEFDKAFRDIVTLALENAEKVREGKSANDVYPLTASIVQIQRSHWGVELYLGKAGVHMKDGFDSHGAAQNWVTYGSADYLREKGVRKGTKIHIVGKEFY